ncbi:MAG: SPOR domain-containing protein [Halothiobacillus sp.]|jgi:cell division protein FtsN|nr:SPOR domain-containing protein [Halothiobacillus sp.]
MAQSKRSPTNRHRSSTPPTTSKWIVVLLLVVAGLLVFIAAHLWKKEDPTGYGSMQHDARSVKKMEQKPPVKPDFEFYTLLPQQSNSPVIPSQQLKPAPPVKPSAPTVPDKTAAPVKELNYWIQAGSFATQAEADRRKAEIAMQGFSSEVHSAEVNGKHYYRIQIGPIKSSQLSDVKRRLSAAEIDTLPPRTSP